MIIICSNASENKTLNFATQQTNLRQSFTRQQPFQRHRITLAIPFSDSHAMESELWPHLDDLEDGVEKLSSVLKPLMEENMAKNASQLPLLDKAKLYILTTYTIESLIFCKTYTQSRRFPFRLSDATRILLTCCGRFDAQLI